MSKESRPESGEALREIDCQIAGIFIFSADDKILLGNAGVYKDALSIPGGHIEEGESPLEAAIREIREETAIIVTENQLRQLPQTKSGKSEKTLRETGERVVQNMTFYDFVANMPQESDQIEIMAGDDFSNIGWYSAEDLVRRELSPTVKRTLIELGFLKEDQA